MAGIDTRGLDSPKETRAVPKGTVEVYELGGAVVYRATFEPGWRWSESLKDMYGTESCPKDHIAYQVSGRIGVVMDDGSEGEILPGQVWRVGPGHDAWVLGDEPAVFLDFGDARG